MDIRGKTLETGRLILREWREADAGDMFEYARVEGVGEMAGWRHHLTIEDSLEMVKRFIDLKSVFALVYKETNKVIGSIGIHPPPADNEGELSHLKTKEIGYVLSKDYWGQGLMPEGVKAVIGFCFGECGIEALTCGHFLSNNQSKRVIEKCGFSPVRQDKYFAKQLDKTFDEMTYILFPENIAF